MYKQSNIGTGSLRERDKALIFTRCPSSYFMAGHPIDAPESMPAGCWDSVIWYDSRGRPVGHQSEVKRAA